MISRERDRTRQRWRVLRLPANNRWEILWTCNRRNISEEWYDLMRWRSNYPWIEDKQFLAEKLSLNLCLMPSFQTRWTVPGITELEETKMILTVDSINHFMISFRSDHKEEYCWWTRFPCLIGWNRTSVSLWPFVARKNLTEDRDVH